MSRSVIISLLALAIRAQYTATYLPGTAPDKTENGQTGTNRCGNGNSQDSMCQNAYINNVDDWCIWAPPTTGSIGDTERVEVAWCIKPGYGTRLIPDGTIKGAHFVKTPDFVQVTGTGDLTKINVPAGDAGGELDPHGADGNGNPVGGLVFSNAFAGTIEQLHEWTNFVSDTEFCFRACKNGPKAPEWCQHIYDVMGCFWNMPANYDAGVFEQCDGDSGEPMGVYGTSTFHQGEPVTPDAHPVPSSSHCTPLQTIGNNVQFTAAPGTSGPTATPPSNTTLPSNTGTGSVTTTTGNSTQSQTILTTTPTSTTTLTKVTTPAGTSKTGTSTGPNPQQTTPSAASPILTKSVWTSLVFSLLGGLIL